MRIPTVFGLLLILGLGAIGFTNLASGCQVPDDFKVVATYSAGFSTWKQWETTITDDGKAVQKIQPGRNGGRDEQKTSMLSPDDLKALSKAIKDADFATLKESYRSLATDQPTLILEITEGAKTHKVSVYGPSLLKTEADRAAARRFLRVYSEVLRAVPSPNPDQTPEMYAPKDE
jgi:hypothetical protein